MLMFVSAFAQCDCKAVGFALNSNGTVDIAAEMRMNHCGIVNGTTVRTTATTAVGISHVAVKHRVQQGSQLPNKSSDFN